MTSPSPAVANWWPSAISSRAQLGEIVDLAVERADDLAVLAAERLARAFEIDDRQPPEPQRHPAVDVLQRRIVGSTMGECVAHPGDQRLIEALPSICNEDEAAHTVRSISRRAVRYTSLRMHVLHIIDGLGLGGAERMLVDIANATVADGQIGSLFASHANRDHARA